MRILLALSACAPSNVVRPGNVPAGAARIWFSDDAVWVDQARIVDRAEWVAAPTQAIDDRLVGALAPGRAVWVDAPADAPYWLIRTAVGSARAAQADELYVGVGPDAVLVGPGPMLNLGSCELLPGSARGAAPLVTFAPETDGRSTWLRATARFLLVADSAGSTVGLNGCLLPAPRVPLDAGACLGGDLLVWRTQVAGAVRAFGLTNESLLSVVPEARTPMRAVLPVLLGLADAGIAAPGFPSAVLIEGNDGPPECGKGVGDWAALAAVGSTSLEQHGGALSVLPAPPVARAP